jgi:hypothetical protein
MRKNHVPAMVGLSALVLILVAMPKENGTFKPSHVGLALIAGLMGYVYASLFDLGQGQK